MLPEDWLERCARKTTSQLFEDMRQLHQVEGQMLVPILAHLSEIDRRGAAIEAAFPSMFVYCVRELGYSEAEAYLRIRVARAARRFPRILGMVARREIHITAIARIAPYLTAENYRNLLSKAARRTQEELQRLIAELAPQQEKRPVIRMLSVGNNVLTAKDDLFLIPGKSEDTPQSNVSGMENEGQLSSDGRAEQSPQGTSARVLFHFVGAESLQKKFKRARSLLWHKYPHGQPDKIFEDALDALLDRKDPERRIARKIQRMNKRKNKLSQEQKTQI